MKKILFILILSSCLCAEKYQVLKSYCNRNYQDKDTFTFICQNENKKVVKLNKEEEWIVYEREYILKDWIETSSSCGYEFYIWHVNYEF